MENLVTKEVNFNGSALMAVQSEDGNIHVGVKWICQGLGLSKGQMQAERVRIQEDLVLSQGGRKIVLPTKGGKQEVLCIELDFLPLWLAKINANIINNSMVQDKLIDYQLHAAKVLAAAFADDRITSKEFLPSKENTQLTRAKAMLLNAKTRAAQTWLKIAEAVNIPEYKQIASTYAANTLADKQVLELPTAERKTYSATDIAKQFNITKNMIGKIANEHNLKTTEYGKLFYDKSPYSSKQVETWRYYENAIPAFAKILGVEVIGL